MIFISWPNVSWICCKRTIRREKYHVFLLHLNGTQFFNILQSTFIMLFRFWYQLPKWRKKKWKIKFTDYTDTEYSYQSQDLWNIPNEKIISNALMLIFAVTSFRWTNIRNSYRLIYWRLKCVKKENNRFLCHVIFLLVPIIKTKIIDKRDENRWKILNSGKWAFNIITILHRYYLRHALRKWKKSSNMKIEHKTTQMDWIYSENIYYKDLGKI